MFELRTYRCHPGRIDQACEGLRLNARTLFVRHGFRPIAFWRTPGTDSEERSIVYLLEWRDAAEQAACWDALKADDAWREFLEETQRRGPAISDVRSVAVETVPDMPVVAPSL